jgi:hypothetical protein
VHTVRRLHAVLVVQMLELPFHSVECVGIEQLSQLRISKQFAQLRLVNRQGLRTSLCQRGVAVIDVVRDVAEEERRRERRRHARIDRS